MLLYLLDKYGQQKCWARVASVQEFGDREGGVVRQCGVGMFLGQETQKQDDLHRTAMKGQVGVECYGKIMI
jgi:hypothetical protein